MSFDANTMMSVSEAGVVVGVLLEGTEYVPRIHNSWPALEKIGFLLLVLALVGDWHFQSVINQRQTQALIAANERIATLNLQTATANEGAVKALRKAVDDEIGLIQLQEKLAWRHIDAEEASVFDDNAGAALAGHTVILSANSSDPEARAFALDIDAALTMAHAKVKRVFRLDKGNLSPGVNCLATKGTASERDAFVISHSLRVMAPPFPCAIMYRSPTDLGPAEINVGAKPEL